MSKHSDTLLIKSYLEKKAEKNIFNVSLTQLHLSCGLPKRIKNKDLKDYIATYHSNFNIC